MSEGARPPVEITWLWRRIFTYLASLANAGLLAAVIAKVKDPQGLAALGLALVAANVVLATLYLAGATVTDWARIAGAARGEAKAGEDGS
ncbi:hypothetical protein [Phenylobacterium sp.]|uniref:hypothetical protein n=1 Tax=Phenylobacterium sp. TaxID=1871053 RepID=UPI0025D5FBD7|nr:hypothetical protein [Phenylobacterium sp.]MCA6287333.1 hypothetical protein [Phenylobacterium sp.]MCA6289328.1 hypothetical protein [Phenylobacterium sp.]MCA6311464.1 hypothetical protein [Phenylobacterium sp.]MCA6324175.1 hypothetical protein [Phenylobacterium sp.]MCA6337726.1 hypothetical protein [Phenylobacterium sp.]